MKLTIYVIITAACFSFFTHASQNLSKKLVGLQEDIPMGKIGGVQLSINIAFPAKITVKPRPVVMLIHGGGFISGDKSSKNKQIVKLSKLGFVSASAMYRLSPEYKFPAAIEDIKLAIRFLKANAAKYHIDPDRIIVSGSSAGSYLAVMAGVTGNSPDFSDHNLYTHVDSTVRAVTAQSAPIADLSLNKYIDTATVKRLLPNQYTDLTSTLSAMSATHYLDVNDPPFFLSHGDSDPVIPVQMSREFVNELQRIDHTYEYHEVIGGTHSFRKSAPKQSKAVFSAYIKFLQKWAK